MKRVKRVEDLNIRTIRAQGIVGAGVCIRTFTASSPAAAFHRMASAGLPVASPFFARASTQPPVPETSS